MNFHLLLLCLLVGLDPAVPADRVSPSLEPSRTVFGLPAGSVVVRSGLVARNQNLSVILSGLGLSPKQIQNLARAARSVFDVRTLRSGRPWQVFSLSQRHRYLVYGQTARDYVVFDLGDTPRVYRGQKRVNLREHTVSATVTHSLSRALSVLGLPPVIANRLADVFQGEVDFKKLSRGDRFSLIYEQQWIADRLVGTGKVKAAWFQHKGKSFYRFLFE